MTRLKMYVESVKRNANVTGGVDSEEITLRAVYGSGNEQWAKWTPVGELRFTINRDTAALGTILPGQFYFADLAETTKEGA